MDLYLLQLMLTKGLGEAALKRILRYGSIFPDCTPETICREPDLLYRILGSSRSAEDMIKALPSAADPAARLRDALARSGADVLPMSDPRFPARVQDSLGERCPPVLFFHGNVDLLSTAAAGICGSRRTSQRGFSIAALCGRQLARAGITVVSGYANGADLASHMGALEAGGNTVFVLAEGILKYRTKRGVRDFLTDRNHVFVSQFLPETQWSSRRAIRRNALLLSLSGAVILVEARGTGISFAAGEEALRREIPLFVVDYADPPPSAEGNRLFLSRGGVRLRGKNGIPCIDRVVRTVMDGSGEREPTTGVLSLET